MKHEPKKPPVFLFLLFLLLPLMSNAEIPASFESDLIEPVLIKEVGENHYFIDFGKAFFGTVVLESRSAQTEPLVIHLGEKLSDDYSIDRQPPGTIRYQSVKVSALVPGEVIKVQTEKVDRNTSGAAILLPDSFGVVMPFRYCEIENLKIPVEDLKIRQLAYFYEFNDNASYFHSSDTILNQIWEMCKHSIKATSFAGYYVDGDRERIPYEADAFINQLSHYAVDSVYSLARRTNEYFIDHPTWPTEWILHTAFLFYYDYLYTGYKESMAKYYDDLKLRTLMELEREDGLISTFSENMNEDLMRRLGFEDEYRLKRGLGDIVDWPAGERDNYDMVEVNTVVNAFYYQNLVIMSKIAEVLDKEQDARLFAEKAEIVRQVFNEKFLSKETGLYLDGLGSVHSSLHANMFPLAFDMVPENYIPGVISFMKTKGMACSVYGAQYLLEALCKYGEEKYAYQLITDTLGERNWYNMIRSGSTIAMEAWDIKYKPNLDWNHAWGTAPANILIRYMFGITPGSPGFGIINIKPDIPVLEFAKAKVPTTKGTVNVEYRKHDDDWVSYHLSLPKETTANFFPGDDVFQIFLNGKKVQVKDGFVELSDTDYEVKYRK